LFFGVFVFFPTLCCGVFNNVRIKKNPTTQCRNKGETPQHNVGIKKNTTKQCRNENKNTKKQ
jgi:hypothetical protein